MQGVFVFRMLFENQSISPVTPGKIKEGKPFGRLAWITSFSFYINGGTCGCSSSKLLVKEGGEHLSEPSARQKDFPGLTQNLQVGTCLASQSIMVNKKGNLVLMIPDAGKHRGTIENRTLFQRSLRMNVLEDFQGITTFVFDVDGVMTDGGILLLENGLQARRMNIKDGLALQMAISNGYRVLVISGGSSEPVIRRLQYLGLEEINLGLKDKLKFMQHYLETNGIKWNEVLYMGDDLPDIPVLEQVGLSCCPADAAIEVKKLSKYISPIKGGFGCVRDVIEKVLKLNDHWQYHTGISSR
jgi:3-deoxy-D-manno-octulosonate 8-phosphate phosphatase (KDO 8-P phosphatase)